MISIWTDWTGGLDVSDRPARSLGLFAGNPASSSIDNGWAYAQLSRPRAKPQRGWRPAQHASGRRVLFNGWFDNRDEIAAALGLPSASSDADVYLAAVERWGADADLRCIGSYCAIVADQDDRSIRLARSPYDGPPLYYHRNSRQAIAASVPRAIFAAGITAQLSRKRLVRNLLSDFKHYEGDWYEGITMVPLGTTVMLSPAGERLSRFYNPLDYIGKTPLPGDAAENANALLEEAAGKVLGRMHRPGILLSGGLDSPLAAAAMMRRMTGDTPLHSFTFVPSAKWDGRIAAGGMGDEAPLVREFAAMHPRLKPQFFSNEGITFDHKSREMLMAMGIAPAGMSNLYMYHALHEAAVAAGCDGIVSADLGNATYSNNGEWVPGEQFRGLRWGRLARNLLAPDMDWRSPGRRFAAYVAMPMLPARLRAVLRKAIKDEQPGWFTDAVTAIHPQARLSAEAHDAQGRPIDFMEGTYPRDRHHDAQHLLDGGIETFGDTSQGFEQIHGLPRRDLSGYRPLVEHCLSLPGEEYLCDGSKRYLARRMGKGRLPEQQRTNLLYGSHGIDWHSRMSAQRESLLEEIRRYRNDPELAGLLDLDRMIAALENWPEQDPLDIRKSGPAFQGVTRTVWTSRFIHFVNGKN